MFDCGFFVQLFMEKFDSKVMTQFANNAIPDHRRLVAASLIENRDNGQYVVEKLMEDELIKRKQYPA
jgi:Ulp1 family protease